MARPRIEIDQVQFEKLCEIQCTLEEIAGVLKCSPDTIENWCKRTYNESFSETYKKHSANGKMSIRRMQFKLAETNATMCIWLGKQYLGQTDKIELGTEDNTEIKVSMGMPSEEDIARVRAIKEKLLHSD